MPAKDPGRLPNITTKWTYISSLPSIGCKFNFVLFATSEMGGEQKHGSTYKDHPIQVEIPLLPL
jgi:hypothetical protein